MWSERREAKRRGLNVHQYRIQQRAESAGRSYDEQLVLEMVVRMQGESGLPDIGLYDWYVANKSQFSRNVGALLTRESHRRRMTVRQLIETTACGGEMPHMRLFELALYDDPPRVVVPVNGDDGVVSLMTHPITSATTATVDAHGGIAATRGRDLAEKGLATAVTMSAGLGPAGAFFFGNAKETIHDGREPYLLLSDDDWSHTLFVHPDLGGDVRAFAQEINRLARTRPKPATTQPADVTVERLHQLAELHRDGRLTDAEFEQLKAQLLAHPGTL